MNLSKGHCDLPIVHLNYVRKNKYLFILIFSVIVRINFLIIIIDISPPKQIISDHSLSFFQARLSPASVVYFNWLDKSDGGNVTLYTFTYKCMSSVREKFIILFVITF